MKWKWNSSYSEIEDNPSSATAEQPLAPNVLSWSKKWKKKCSGVEGSNEVKVNLSADAVGDRR
jgi:hypothetical protein